MFNFLKKTTITIGIFFRPYILFTNEAKPLTYEDAHKWNGKKTKTYNGWGNESVKHTRLLEREKYRERHEERKRGSVALSVAYTMIIRWEIINCHIESSYCGLLSYDVQNGKSPTTILCNRRKDVLCMTYNSEKWIYSIQAWLICIIGACKGTKRTFAH